MVHILSWGRGGGGGKGDASSGNLHVTYINTTGVHKFS